MVSLMSPPPSSSPPQPVSDHNRNYNKQPAAEKAAAAKALARASARASVRSPALSSARPLARATGAVKRSQSERHDPASEAKPPKKRRQLRPRDGQANEHEIEPVLPNRADNAPPSAGGVPHLPLPQQTSFSAPPHVPATSSLLPISGPTPALPTANAIVGRYEEVWNPPITQTQHELSTILPQGQYQGYWASMDRAIGTFQHGPWIDSKLATPAPTQVQPPMQWNPLLSQTKPDRAVMFDLGPRRYETQTQQDYFSGPTAGSIPYSGTSSNLGTAACPITLDDGPLSFTPSLFDGPNGHPPQMNPTHPPYYPPRLAESKEDTAADFVAHPTPQMLPATAGHSTRPFLPHFNEADRQPSMGSPPYLGFSAQYSFDNMGYPYNNSFPVPPLQQNSFTTTVVPPSITGKPAKTDVQGTRTPAMDEPPLCPEQADLVHLILQGHNVFYTGSAGCGKSTVLRTFVRRLRDMGKKVQILAPTGRAALNVGGSTTWTFAGWRPDSHKKPLRDLENDAFFGKTVKKRLKDTDVLVIDEISMVENLHFERLNAIMKSARYEPGKGRTPFGGCQIIVTGDFCQLPPVKPFRHCIQCGKELAEKVDPDNKLIYECRQHGIHADEDKWAFRSKAWQECGFKHIHLKTIHRQNDQVFIQMLQKCRLGEQLTESEIFLLMNHKARVSQATKLFCTRREADDVNRAAFDKIKAEKHLYWAHDTFICRQKDNPRHQRNGVRSDWHNVWADKPPKEKKPLLTLGEHRFSECVQLKKGGLVVLLANLDLPAGLCNGSQGVICGFEDHDPTKMPIRELREELVSGSKFKLEMTKVTPKPGQRVLRGENAGTQEQEIKNFIASECVPIKKWPVVQFHNGVRRIIYGECSITQLGDEEPYSLLMRTQLPLAPAWAMTVHKSQSLTLDRVIVNLDRVFEEGQVYVALSRATGLGGLKIEGDGRFLRDKLMVNAEVAAFLKEKFGDIYDRTEAITPGDVSAEEASFCSPLVLEGVS